MLWEKGYGRLWDLLAGYQGRREQPGQGASPARTNAKGNSAAGRVAGDSHTSAAAAVAECGRGSSANGDGVLFSAYGSGPDGDAIRERAESMGLAVEFTPATDHAELSMYKTFVNPSESEVLCTAVAEALAMGKFVVIAEHASNEFFYQFPNTLKFTTQEEFNEQVSVESTGLCYEMLGTRREVKHCHRTCVPGVFVGYFCPPIGRL